MSEYWITPDDVIFCDGDSGVDVPNHEMVVVMRALSLVMGKVLEVGDELACELFGMYEQHVEDDPSFSECFDMVAYRENLNNLIDGWVDGGLLTAEESQDIDELIVTRYGIDRELYAVANAIGDDPREYAVRVWRWIRVIGGNIDTFDLDHEFCRRMGRFLDQEEESSVQKTYNIEVRNRSGRVPRFILDVPFSALWSVRAIRKHMRGLAPV